MLTPWRPKILSPKSKVHMINLRDKSLGPSFINLTYFKFACGEENPLKLLKISNIMTMIVWENSFSLFLLYLRF